jgi:hypothetical protein
VAITQEKELSNSCLLKDVFIATPMRYFCPKLKSKSSDLAISFVEIAITEDYDKHYKETINKTQTTGTSIEEIT